MTAEELLNAARTWKRPGCRTRTRYAHLGPTIGHLLAVFDLVVLAEQVGAHLDPTIEHLLAEGWQPKEIVEQLVRIGVLPREKAPALKDHVCRLYRRRQTK